MNFFDKLSSNWRANEVYKLLLLSIAVVNLVIKPIVVEIFVPFNDYIYASKIESVVVGMATALNGDELWIFISW